MICTHINSMVYISLNEVKMGLRKLSSFAIGQQRYMIIPLLRVHLFHVIEFIPRNSKTNITREGQQ